MFGHRSSLHFSVNRLGGGASSGPRVPAHRRLEHRESMRIRDTGRLVGRTKQGVR